MAMAVGKRNHYRLDQIAPRHFDETAARARVGRPARRQAFEEMAQQAPVALDSVSEQLPKGFPSDIAEQIIAYALARLPLLEHYANDLQKVQDP